MVYLFSGNMVYASSIKALEKDVFLFINENPICLKSYQIDGEVYFKLRDFAILFNKTNKPFNVSWDNELKSIKIDTDETYVEEETENNLNHPFKIKAADLVHQEIYLDNELIPINLYQIQENNYINLIDFINLFDLNISWIDNLHTIRLSTFDKEEETLDLETIDLLKLPEKEPLTKADSLEDLGDILLFMIKTETENFSFEVWDDFYKEIMSDRSLYSKAFNRIHHVETEYFALFNAFEALIKDFNDHALIQFTLKPNQYDDLQDVPWTILQNEFIETINDIMWELIQSGEIDEKMTETEIAKFLYQWLVFYLEYDTDLNDISFTPYGAITNKIAVCQAYVGIYNYMCDLAGIKNIGVYGQVVDRDGYHIWTLASLDGEELYIDVTFGDPVVGIKNICDFTYFAVTEEFLSKDHIWDTSEYQL